MTLLEKANKSNGLLQLKLNGHQLNTVVNSGNAVNRVKSVIANLQQQQPVQTAIQLSVLRSSNNNSVTTNPSINNNNNSTVPITTIAPSAVAASSSTAHRAHQPPRSLASFMANRCCVCSRLLRNYRGNRLAKSYEITIDPNDLLSSRSHNHHHSNESVRGHLNGDASTLVNNNSNNTNRSNHRISRLLTKHLALSSAKNSSQNGDGGDSSDSVSQKRKLCQSCYDHLNQIDSHMKSVIRLRSLMKAKLRKSLRLVSSGNKPVLRVLRRHRRGGGSNNNNGFVKLVADSSDLIVKSENNINNRVGGSAAASNRSASNKMNLSKQLMINAAANSNNDTGLASSAQASSSSISSSPSATSLSPATNNVYSSHLNQNGTLSGLYVQPQTEQFLRLNPEILALLAATSSLSNNGNNNNASFELASLANMDLKPTLISPPSSSSNRRKRKSQNPSRLLNKGDSMTFNLDENNNNQLQVNNNNQALNLAKLVAAATTTAQVKSKLANMAKQQQQQQLKTKTTKTTINITDNQAGRSIGRKAAHANALSHFIPNNKENDAHGNKRRSLQVKSDLDDELDDEQMINDEELHQVDEIKNNDDQEEENNELGDEEPIDETCGVQDEDPDMNGGDNSQYDDPMYDEDEDEDDDDEAHQHQMNGFDEEDDEENNNNSNNDELGGAYGAEEGDDEEEDEEEDHSLVGGTGSGSLLRSQGRAGLSTSTSTTTLTHHNNIPIKHLFEAAHSAAQQRVKLNTNQVRNNSAGLKSKKYSLTNGDMEGNNTNQVANVLLSMSGSKSSSSSANNLHHSSNNNNNNNNDPEFKHNCNICRKSFKTQNILRQHMRIHTGDKPFVCDLCNKAFSQMASLKYHQATHSDDRPYKCDGCAKTFKLKPPFKKHIKDCPQRLAILGANPGSTSSNNNAALISLLNASGLAGLVDHDDDNDDDIND